MVEKIPKNTKNIAKPYKRDVFDAYVAWRSIPAIMRSGNAGRMGEDMVADDARFEELLVIKNQSEFAKKYDVENSTLTNWNKLIEKKEVMSEVRKWGQKFTKNVLFALYRDVLENGNAEGVKLWLQVVEGWSYSKGKADIARPEHKPVTISIITKTTND